MLVFRAAEGARNPPFADALVDKDAQIELSYPDFRPGHASRPFILPSTPFVPS